MKLAVTTVGEGPHNVVFLHGLFGQGRNFVSTAKAIADIATSYLVDLPNHGRSPWTLDFTLDGQADVVRSWLEETFTDPVTLVGHSLGGKLAMRVALTSPELVKQLEVVDISPARSSAVDGFASMVAAMRNLDLDALTSRRDAEEQLGFFIPDAATRGFLLQNLRRNGEHWSWLANLDLLGDSLNTIGGWPSIGGVYDGPVLWVAGGESDYVAPEHYAPMKALFPQAIKVTVKGAGHLVHTEEPEVFIDSLRRFLQG